MSGSPSLTFTEHLEELRGRLIICLLAVIATTLIALPFADNVLVVLSRPLGALAPAADEAAIITLRLSPDGSVEGHLPPSLATSQGSVPVRLVATGASGETVSLWLGQPESSRLYYFRLTDPIVLILKTAVIMGLVLALPLVAWQMWLFIAPGLTARERRLIKPILWFFAALFPLGAAFGYWLMHFAVVVLTGFAFGGMRLLPDTSAYVSIILTMMTAFGLVFELPAVLLILARMGIITADWLAQRRKFAIVLAFLVAAILTPPDVFTQFAMAIPILILYELSIWLARLTEPGKSA